MNSARAGQPPVPCDDVELDIDAAVLIRAMGLFLLWALAPAIPG
ncbi:MAG: hypothetical protein OXU39_09650 [Gemmatimonadota bacterium]|nr:hypothetical protein [Gemmatimonadota bacterium]